MPSTKSRSVLRQELDLSFSLFNRPAPALFPELCSGPQSSSAKTSLSALCQHSAVVVHFYTG